MFRLAIAAASSILCIGRGDVRRDALVLRR